MDNSDNTQKNENKGDFGRYLKKYRLDRNLSLSDISKETRIVPDTLNNIENEILELLPSDVYVKGFLRAFAKAVGANGDLVIQKYIINYKAHQKEMMREYELKQRKRRIIWRIVQVLFLFLCIAGIAFFFISSRQNYKSGGQPKLYKIDEAKKNDTASRESLQKTTDKKKNSKKKYSLSVFVIDDTWMKIIVDAEQPTQYQLKAGEELSFEAKKGYNILIGNGKNIIIRLNGVPVNIPRRDGHAVSIQLPPL